MARAWVGRQGEGSREYEPIHYDRVVRAMAACVGPARALSQDALAALPECVGISPRAIRAILSDADGREFVLVYDDRGLYTAERAEQAEGFTRNLLARARSLGDRAERRRQFTEAHLRQPAQVGLGL